MKTLSTLIAVGLLSYGSIANAAAVVLDNQTAENIEFTIHWDPDRQSRHTLVAGDLRPVAVTGAVEVEFKTDGQARRCMLQPNSIHRFVRSDRKLKLLEQKLPKIRGAPADDARRRPSAAMDSIYTVPVKLLADDQEPTVRKVWEKRLRDRMAEASAIFERHCRVRLEVVAVDTWVANTDIDDFNLSAADFERKVRPEPARLAIGFTGHYKWEKGEKHVGGIRGPLRPHILIREALVKVSEPERLEVLVHELGHFLGAVHASDGNSVMRPTLGDRRACVRGFRIGFDAPNTLALYLIGEQLRRGPLLGLCQLPSETKTPLRRVYAWLAHTLPDDPAAPKFQALLDFPFPVHSRNDGAKN